METYLISNKTIRNYLLIALLTGIVWTLYFGIKNTLASEVLLIAVIAFALLLFLKK